MPFSSPNTPVPQIALRSHTVVPVDNGHVDRSDLRLLEQTFKLLPDVVMIYDVDTRQVVYSNRTFASVLGYENDSVSEAQLLHPADAVRMTAQLQDILLLKDEDTGNITYRLKDAHDQWRWFSERQVVFKRHADGTVAQVLKTARYEKKPPINTASVTQHDLLRLITEYNLPNFAFLLFDHDLCHTVATGMLLRRMGLSSDELEGHTFHEVAQPDMADWLEPAYQAALSGAEIKVERTVGGMIVCAYCSPVWNEHGEITAGMVLAQDVTDERQSQAALVESEQRFAQFSENMPAIFWMMDTDQRRLLYVSPALKDVWGITPEAAYENPASLVDIIHPDDRQMTRDTFLETFRSGRHDIKFRILTPSGDIRWLTSRAFPIYDDAGNLYRLAGLGNDITEQLETEKIRFDLESEREHSRLLTQIIGNISHEFRTPMTIINTSLYLVKKTNDPVKQGERLHIIERQVAQLARLVEQMGLLLRVENLHDVRTSVPVALNTMLTKLETDYAPTLAKKELTLELIFGDNVPNIVVDPALLLVALQNVLENAINYTDVGHIIASTATEGDQVVLTVKDTGIGIDVEDLPHIFERFYKAESNKRRDVIAAGLGLTIAQRIMQISGGRVEVESQVGSGSTFRLVWPVGK